MTVYVRVETLTRRLAPIRGRHYHRYHCRQTAIAATQMHNTHSDEWGARPLERTSRPIQNARHGS